MTHLTNKGDNTMKRKPITKQEWDAAKLGTDEPLEFVPALEKVVSLATLAVELGVGVDALASELGEAVVTEPLTNLRVVDVATSHRAIELHHEGVRRRAEAARLNEEKLLASQPAPTRCTRGTNTSRSIAARGSRRAVSDERRAVDDMRWHGRRFDRNRSVAERRGPPGDSAPGAANSSV